MRRGRKLVTGGPSMAEIAAVYPGLAAMATARSVDPAEAKWLDGPGLAEWLIDLGLTALTSTEARAIRRWRGGAMAKFYAVDRLLCNHGHALAQIPDDLWRTEGPNRYKHGTANREQRIAAVKQYLQIPNRRRLGSLRAVAVRLGKPVAPDEIDAICAEFRVSRKTLADWAARYLRGQL